MTIALSSRSGRAGFTLIEALVAFAILGVVGVFVTNLTGTQTLLFAKNTSLNSSHTSARSTLDRLANELQQSQNLPSLIDASGNPTAATTAAGVTYDRLVGAPYKLEHPGGSGLAATATAISVTRSTNSLASPPIPVAGDVLLIDLPTGLTLRAQVSTAVITNTDAAKKQQTLKLTLTGQLGTAVSWDSTQVKTAQVVRRQAFIVVPNGPRNELRFYQTFEPAPVVSSSANYVLITNEVSTAKNPDGTPRDVTPFSIDTSGGNKLVKASLRMQAKDFDSSLKNKQANSFNTFVQINVTLPSRLRPKS